jgi:hypothetical protein
LSSGEVAETTTHLSVSSVFSRSARSISDTAGFLSVNDLRPGSATGHPAHRHPAAAQFLSLPNATLWNIAVNLSSRE